MPASPQKIAEANKHPLNRAALKRLQQAKEFNPEGANLHLLALAWWGLEQDARRSIATRTITSCWNSSWD